MVFKGAFGRFFYFETLSTCVAAFLNIFMKHQSTNPTGLGYALLAVAFAFPWLIPEHTAPLPSFFTNVSAALVIAPIALWSFLAHRQPVIYDHLAFGFSIAAAIPLLQAASGLFVMPSEAPLVSLHLFGIALSISIARHSDHKSSDKLLTALFCGLLLASLLSVSIALSQWLQIDSDLIGTNLVIKLPDGSRPYANLAQPNDLSTLLVWGVLSVLWLQTTNRLNSYVALILVIFLLLGVVATQSRTGFLALLLISTAVVVLPIVDQHVFRMRVAVVTLSVFYTALTFFWKPLTLGIGLHSKIRSVEEIFSSDIRYEIWITFLSGIHKRPFFGYGWDQGRVVQMDNLQTETRLPIFVQHAHNVLLDLIIWNGIPLGVIIIALLSVWFSWQLKKSTTATQKILFLALTVLVLHSMLELPHLNAYFLAPAAMMMGILNNRAEFPWKLEVSRWMIALVCMVVSVILMVSIRDYQQIGDSLRKYRFYLAKIGPAAGYVEPVAPTIYVLTATQSALLNLRIEPKSRMTEVELNKLRGMAYRYPMESTYLRFAQAAALNGLTEEAQTFIDRWCFYQTGTSCVSIQRSWKNFQSESLDLTGSK